MTWYLYLFCLSTIVFLATLAYHIHISKKEKLKRKQGHLTMKTTQKQLAVIIDQAASRAPYPATGKQCWFLAKLMLDVFGDDRSAIDIASELSLVETALTGKQASTFIGWMLEETNKVSA